MPYTKPIHSKKQVSKAGQVLIDDNVNAVDYMVAIYTVNNWRSSHSYPLQIIKNTLAQRAKKLCKNPVIAQRLKRISSIKSKLKILKNSQLARMQDIGGCRAIVDSIDEVYDLVIYYDLAKSKNPEGRPQFIEENDYIENPKESGYRSFHLIMKYQSTSDTCQVFNGHKIEIQIRTKLQHAWATAVETTSTFLGQNLKSSIGDEKWLRFFALASTAFAFKEGTPSVPNTYPSAELEGFLVELRAYWEELKVETFLRGCQVATKNLPRDMKDSDRVLLKLDAKERIVKVKGFGKNDVIKANEALFDAEREFANNPEMQVVLVSVDDVSKLKAAYPNYYADTSVFLDAMMKFMKIGT